LTKNTRTAFLDEVLLQPSDNSIETMMLELSRIMKEEVLEPGESANLSDTSFT
jgi:hypothetical protein